MRHFAKSHNTSGKVVHKGSLQLPFQFFGTVIESPRLMPIFRQKLPPFAKGGLD
jgi:hypothetical protein